MAGPMTEMPMSAPSAEAPKAPAAAPVAEHTGFLKSVLRKLHVIKTPVNEQTMSTADKATAEASAAVGPSKATFNEVGEIVSPLPTPTAK
ncbi:MAG TPA: hypothetical protein VLE91_00100 [Candidatus Saccharimonadales bacterium]|nr:hypothetical protein [Candidatus Saccharimonadales bacterium]